MTRRAHAIAISSILAFYGCATPIPPSGGAPDQIPPELAESIPPQGAVNVDAESVRFTFSEYVDEASFAQAFSISPAFDRPVEFEWSRRRVVVRFPEPLRENTTYVLTIDTHLLDLHRVALTTPIVYAFSTGPTISAGTLMGRVVAPSDGAPASAVDVLAYARPDSTAPDSLDDRPAYRTQTDSEGNFTFEYLTEQFYYVAALRDDNRNLVPDPQEAFAAPPAPALLADTTAEMLVMPWVLANVDTTAPAPLRAQSAARSRHLVRFTEPVRFLDRDPTRWTLVDSATGEPSDIHILYLLESDPRQVHLVTEDLASRSFHVTPAALVDTSGNVVDSDAIELAPAQLDDTLRIRFVEFLPARPPVEEVLSLPRGVEPGIRFNRPISDELLAATVSVTDSAGIGLSFAAVTQNGTDYEILIEPRIQPGQQIIVAVDASQISGPDTTYELSVRRIPAEETGEIAGYARTVTVAADTTITHPINASSVVVQAYPVAVDSVTFGTFEATADADGSFVIPALPAGTYRLRAFADADSSGAWDPGLLAPYHPAEGIAWHTEPLRVRSRWETALPDTLRIPVPQSLQR